MYNYLQNIMEIIPVRARLFHVDRVTDGLTD